MKEHLKNFMTGASVFALLGGGFWLVTMHTHFFVIALTATMSYVIGWAIRKDLKEGRRLF